MQKLAISLFLLFLLKLFFAPPSSTALLQTPPPTFPFPSPFPLFLCPPLCLSLSFSHSLSLPADGQLAGSQFQGPGWRRSSPRQEGLEPLWSLILVCGAKKNDGNKSFFWQWHWMTHFTCGRVMSHIGSCKEFFAHARLSCRTWAVATRFSPMALLAAELQRSSVKSNSVREIPTPTQ